MAFDNEEVQKLIFKNERKLLYGKSIISFIEGFKFFQSPRIGGLSQSSKKTLSLAKERSERLLKAIEITLDYNFPVDPALKNRIWNEKIKPAREEFLKRLKHEKLCVDLGLPVEATQREVDTRRKEIKRAMLREKTEAKRIEAEAEAKRIQADAEAKQRFRELAEKRLQATRELEARWIQSAREMEAKRIQAEKILEAKKIEAKRRSLGLNAEADPELAEKLFKSAEHGLQDESINSAGYLYLKVWVLPDGSKWYKIGITNDLRRRDAEQNVLPVPATTLHSVRFFNIEHARIVEKKFLETLSSYRIKGANNKELLSLKPEQAQAIVGAMKAIKSCTF